MYDLQSQGQQKVINLKLVHKENKQRRLKFQQKMQEMEGIAREEEEKLILQKE